MSLLYQLKELFLQEKSSFCKSHGKDRWRNTFFQEYSTSQRKRETSTSPRKHESSRMFASKRPERNVSREIPQLVPDKGTHGSSSSRYRFSPALFSSSPARGDFWKSLSKSEGGADFSTKHRKDSLLEAYTFLPSSSPPLFYPC